MQTQAASTQRLFFFTDLGTESPQKRRMIARMPNSIISSNHQTLTADLRSHKPHALIMDISFCKRKSLGVRGFLEGLKSDLKIIPIFLINANFSEFEELISRNVVYAVLPGLPDPQELTNSVARYYAMRKKTGANNVLRQDLSAQCLIKRIGSSGIINGLVVDLSTDGMKVQLPDTVKNWESGDEVRFSIARPEGASAVDHIQGRATIRWTKSPEKGQGASVVGLSFSEIPEQSRSQLSEMLNNARH